MFGWKENMIAEKTVSSKLEIRDFPKICPCIYPFFPKFGAVSTPFCIGYRAILTTGPSYYPKCTLCIVAHKKADVDDCDENLHIDHYVDDVDDHGDVDDAGRGPSGPLHYCDLLHTSAPILYPG